MSPPSRDIDTVWTELKAARADMIAKCAALGSVDDARQEVKAAAALVKKLRREIDALLDADK